jgi:S1-C subfamily serine protease
VRAGDVVVEASGVRVTTLPEFYRAVWRTGPAGVAVPLVLTRGGSSRTVELCTADRGSFLKKPRLQ